MANQVVFHVHFTSPTAPSPRAPLCVAVLQLSFPEPYELCYAVSISSSALLRPDEHTSWHRQAADFLLLAASSSMCMSPIWM